MASIWLLNDIENDPEDSNSQLTIYLLISKIKPKEKNFLHTVNLKTAVCKLLELPQSLKVLETK